MACGKDILVQYELLSSSLYHKCTDRLKLPWRQFSQINTTVSWPNLMKSVRARPSQISAGNPNMRIWSHSHLLNLTPFSHPKGTDTLDKGSCTRSAEAILTTLDSRLEKPRTPNSSLHVINLYTLGRLIPPSFPYATFSTQICPYSEH